MNLAEEVYDSLLDNVIAEYRLPWVESLVQPGMPCVEAYEAVLAAYSRLLLRLNKQEEDPDVEIIIDSLLYFGRIAALKMFEYGLSCQDQHKQ